MEGAIGVLEEDRTRFNRGLDSARQQRDAERAQRMQERLEETEKRLAELQRARDEAVAKARGLGEGSDESVTPLKEAMAELESALAQTAKEPKLFDAKAAADKLNLSTGGMDGVSSQVESRGLSSQGTFNAAAAFGLAAGGVNDRATKAAETTAENTRQLVDHARRGRLVFG